jgi:hypothetical protein
VADGMEVSTAHECRETGQYIFIVNQLCDCEAISFSPYACAPQLLRGVP